MLVGPARAGLGAAHAELSAAAGGEIRSQDGYRLRLSADDLLWLARATQFEGGDNAATIWTLAQRAALHRVSSFTALIRAFAQPVNPRWDEASDELCQRYPERCSPETLERRELARTIPWERISPKVRRLVLRFARAELDNPVPRATNFADPPVSRSYLARTPGARVVLVGGKPANWYLADPGAVSWPADFVTVHYGSRVAGARRSPSWAAGALVGLGVALAGLGGWYWWRRRR